MMKLDRSLPSLRVARLALVLWCVLFAVPRAAAGDIRWTQVRGVNFFSSSASNATEMWLQFDPVLVDRELGWMEHLGFNSLRLWLSEQAWREHPDLFSRNLATALDLSGKHRLSVVLVLFDSCGIEPRADAVEMTIGDAFQHFLSSPSLADQQKQQMRDRYTTFAEGRGRYMLVPVGKDTPPDIIFWQHWTPNPGFSRIGPEHWPELDAYTDAVMKIAAKHSVVVAIDVMNEPATLMDLPAGISYSEAKTRVDAFVAHAATYLEKKYPDAVRTIGSSNLQDMESFARYQTVLSIHSYRLGDELVKTLEAAAAAAHQRNKDLIVSECLANTDDWLKDYGEESISSDEGQLRHYQRTLPIILNSGLGWYSWGGMVGRMFTPATDLVYPSGYLRPAALYLQRELAATPTRKDR